MNNKEYHQITSCTNPLIKKTCGLRQTKRRVGENAFVFEGNKLFNEACAWQVKLNYIFFTEHWLSRNQNEQKKNWESCSAEKILVSESVMEKLSGQKHGEGIFCCGIKEKNSIESISGLRSLIIMENVQDPGNVGTIIRTADAAGFEGVITTEGTADVYGEKVLRASMGSVFHLPIFQHMMISQLSFSVKENGFSMIGSALEGSENGLKTIRTLSKPALIVGNESKGMSTHLKKECDFLVRLPMTGKAESLNVAVAAGLLMYQTKGLL